LAAGKACPGVIVLIVCQFPFADLRPFLATDPHRLKDPPFPVPTPGRHFLRSTGQVKLRRRGVPRVWPEDGRYCEARSAIKLMGISGQGNAGAWENACQGAFRRFYSDGRSTVRFELGLAVEEEACEHLADVAAATLELPVRIPDVGSGHVDVPLFRAGPPLGRHLLDSTTEVTAQGTNTKDWWVAPGRPLLLVEYPAAWYDGFEPPGRAIRQLESKGITLRHARLEHRGDSLSAWFVGISCHVDREVLRELRLHLLRLHAELQAITGVLQAVSKLSTVPGTDSFDALQAFLNDELGLLQTTTRSGLPQAPLLEAALNAVDAIPDAELWLLISELNTARRQVLAKVEKYAQTTRQKPTTIVFTGGGAMVVEGDREYHVDVGGDFSGVIGDQVRVQESFNRIEQAPIGEELKSALKELTAAAAQLQQQAPAELRRQIETLRIDLEAFQQEAVRPEPRRRILEALGDGLRKTAEVAGDIGAPVVHLVATILRLAGAAL
jgi:hypothetical protein